MVAGEGRDCRPADLQRRRGKVSVRDGFRENEARAPREWNRSLRNAIDLVVLEFDLIAFAIDPIADALDPVVLFAVTGQSRDDLVSIVWQMLHRRRIIVKAGTVPANSAERH